jgi:hypothetical protein
MSVDGVGALLAPTPSANLGRRECEWQDRGEPDGRKGLEG